MTATVLDQVSLGYQLFWNGLREPAAVVLSVGVHGRPEVNGLALLQALRQRWPADAVPLLLAVPAGALLSQMLDHAPADSHGLIVDEAQLQDAALARRVHQAHQRGLNLLWRGEPGTRPGAALAPCFKRLIVTMTAAQALNGLRAARLKVRAGLAAAEPQPRGSAATGHIYAEVASRVLADHCLDELDGWAVAGWPTEEVLDGYRRRLVQPGRSVVTRLLEAIDADDAPDNLLALLQGEAILAYRLLRFVNSAGLGLRVPVESLPQAIQLLGYAELRGWLREQLPRASTDLDLQPISTALAVRARLMAQLHSSSGAASADVQLCGLLSQMDLLLGEPLPQALARLPLSAPLKAALLTQGGPYQAALEIALALESPHTDRTRLLCELHEVEHRSVNQTLLQTLAQTRYQPAKSLLLV
jgi:c-di-GMP phosphodiesterase